MMAPDPARRMRATDSKAVLAARRGADEERRARAHWAQAQTHYLAHRPRRLARARLADLVGARADGRHLSPVGLAAYLRTKTMWLHGRRIAPAAWARWRMRGGGVEGFCSFGEVRRVPSRSGGRVRVRLEAQHAKFDRSQPTSPSAAFVRSKLLVDRADGAPRSPAAACGTRRRRDPGEPAEEQRAAGRCARPPSWWRAERRCR